MAQGVGVDGQGKPRGVSGGLWIEAADINGVTVTPHAPWLSWRTWT